uniref:Large ribosomal subunit protein uL29 n=1 Tax=uncultured Nitrospirae bacterium Rifle_16ft_4_minimus_16961 TaxID=1665125 RepID=A0A0H4T190_9BACT|nr:50S ribosomal protein L29 [uncultured Nitrospirae bacterium Rifle_16ft_4_minimus_16961]
MTLDEIRNATQEELDQHEEELKRELFNLRFQKVISGGVENPMRIRHVRKEIARIKTVIRDRQIKK